MFNDFLAELGIYQLLEIAAALAGTYYLIQVRPKDYTKYLVLLLYIIVFVETVGIYAGMAYNSGYEYFSFVKGTPFERNYWLYNIFTIIEFFIFTSYFKSKLNSKGLKIVINVLLCVFVIASIWDNFFSGNYFLFYSSFQFVAGSLMLFVSIGFFYLEILKSEKILYFYKLLPFYISVGTLVFFLVTTPLFIYSSYYSENNVAFLNLYGKLLLFSNIFMYGMFVFGFLKCANQDKSQKLDYSPKSFFQNS